MRSLPSFSLFGVLALVLAPGGCGWSGFDDLQNAAWVGSMQKPNVGSSDYATAIVGATSGADGGRLAVTGNSVPTYSTLQYDTSGSIKLGPNPQKLASHFITSLPDTPILVGDGAGRVALVATGVDLGSISVVIDDGQAVADQPFPAQSPMPTSATFFGSALVIGAGTALYIEDGAMVKACTATDGAAPVMIVALERDDQTVWAWTQSGKVYGYDGVGLMTTCTALSSSAPPNVSPSKTPMATPAPTSNAKMVIVGRSTDPHEWALLAGDSSAGSTISVVDLLATAMTGTGLSADGMASSTFLTAGGTDYVAIGFPRAAVGGVTTGQVELHVFHRDTGMIDADAAETLNDAQPEANEIFGRALTTMTFNGKSILVVAASNEVFGYYRTQLYGDTR